MARLVVLLAVLCGLACFVQAKRNMRVVNGKEYTIEDAPFMVQLNYWQEGKEGKSLDKGAICAGTIVDLVHIVTAAHCLKDLSVLIALRTFTLEDSVEIFDVD